MLAYNSSNLKGYSIEILSAKSKQPKTFEVLPRQQENATKCMSNAENTQIACCRSRENRIFLRMACKVAHGMKG